jgi:hypothetical protein
MGLLLFPRVIRLAPQELPSEHSDDGNCLFGLLRGIIPIGDFTFAKHHDSSAVTTAQQSQLEECLSDKRLHA